MTRIHPLSLCVPLAIILFLTGCSLNAVDSGKSPPPSSVAASARSGGTGDGWIAENGTIPEKLEDEFEILALLQRMDPSESDRIRLQIDGLALREDAMGYYANLYEAMMREAEQQDPSPFYAQAMQLYETREIRLKLADAYLEKGDIEASIEAYAPLLPDNTVLERVLEIGSSSILIGQTLMEKGMWMEAISFLESAMQQGPAADEMTQLSRMHAICMARAERYEAALTLLAPLYAAIPVGQQSSSTGPGVALDGSDAALTSAGIGLTESSISWKESKISVSDQDITFWYARCLEGTEQNSQAMALYRQLGPGAGERLGMMLEKEGRLKEAAEAFIRSGQAGIIWRGTQIAEQLGETEVALEAYLRLQNDSIAPAAAYRDDAAYRAYILCKRLGHPEYLDGLLKELSAHPAWMVRIGKEPVWKPFSETAVESPAYLAKTELYEQRGLGDVAAVEYAIGIRQTTPAEKLALGAWNLKRGESSRSSVWGARALSEVNDREGYALAYPKVFEPFVMSAAKEFDLDPFLIWALMRQESQFQPQVVSKAGAVGLMQMMPATAGDIAARLGVPIEEVKLDDPEINIRFGSFYLRSMLDQFSNNADMALAAYNGGGGNVRRWKKSAHMTAVEDFPTSITYLETREYITIVMDAFQVYKWFYGKG